MADLREVRKGQHIVVVSRDPRGPSPRRRTAVSAGPRWVTDERGDRYDREFGRTERQAGYDDEAMTLEQFGAWSQDRADRAILRRWGLVPQPMVSREHELSPAQLHALAALLLRFETEEAGDGTDQD
jgi:hypothetical protein